MANIQDYKIIMPFARPHGGGSFKSASLLADGLKARGLDVQCVFPKGSSPSPLFLSSQHLTIGAPAISTKHNFIQKALKNIHSFVLALLFLRNKENIIVHCNDDTTILPWAIACWLTRTPCFWHVRQARKGILDPVRLALSTETIFISRFTSSRLNIPNPNIVNNPITQPEYDQDEATSNSFNLIFIGRDVPNKNLNLAINAALTAMSKHESVTLDILSDTPEERQNILLSKIPVHHRDKFNFAGWDDRPEPYYYKATLLLHPAQHEPFGRVFIEAASYGVPFVGLNSGSVPEIIERYNCGISSPTQNDYAETVLELLDSPKKIKELGRNGKEAAVHFRKENVSQNIIRLYERAISDS